MSEETLREASAVEKLEARIEHVEGHVLDLLRSRHGDEVDRGMARRYRSGFLDGLLLVAFAIAGAALVAHLLEEKLC